MQYLYGISEWCLPQYFIMFKTICLSLLISATVSLPRAKHADSKEDRGLILDILGGIVAGDSTTPSPSESTTMATLYGDLVVSRPALTMK